MNRPKTVLKYIFFAFVAAVLHNVVYAIFKIEEPIFFGLAIIFAGIALLNFVMIIMNMVNG